MIRGFKSLFAGGLVGKLLGLLREVLLAYLFGTSSPVAAFRVAQTATFVPLNFFTADTLSAGFLPMHARLRLQDPRLAAVLYKCTSCIVIALGLLMSGLLIVGSKFWIGLLAPGYGSALVEQTRAMVLVMCLGVPFYLITVLASYLEISNGVYRIASLRSTLQSVGLIAGTLAAFYFGQPTFLAWGFTSAYVVLAGWSHMRVSKANMVGSHVRLEWTESVNTVSSLWRAVRPMLYVPVLLQGSIAVERAVTTLISASAAAALDYARLITETALILVAGPLGLTALASFASEKHHIVRMKVIGIASIIVLAGVPLSSFIFLNANILVTVLFARGAFTAEAVDTTSFFLMGLGIGLWAQVLAYFLTKVLSSRHRNREAALSIAIGSLCMISFDIVSFPILGPFGIGLGASLGALSQAIYCCLRLSMMRKTLANLAWLAPGLFLTLVMGPWSADAKGWSSVLLVVSTLIVWAIYLLAIPKTRGTLVGLVYKLRSR